MAECEDVRLVDEALWESEEKYRLIFSKEKDAIVLTDAQTFEFLDVNEAAERLWGYSKDDLLCMTALDVSAEPEKSRLTLVAGVDPQGVETPIRWHKKKDGTVIPVEISAGPFTWRGRKVVCSIIRDISERLKAEETLKREREQLLSIFDSINEVIFVVDTETYEVLFTNKFMKNLYGKELIGGLCYQEVHGLTKPCDHCKKEVVRSLQGEAYRWEYHNSTVNRDYLATDRIIKWTNGRDAKFELAIDVTDKKKAEDALRDSEERFRAIFESTTDCIWVKDRSLTFTHVNSAMCKLTGLPASKIIGRNANDVFGPEAGQQLQALEARVLGGESIDLERTRNVEGTMMTFHDTLVPLRDQGGDIIGLCCISRNVTERRRAAAPELPDSQDYPAPAMRAALRQARLAAVSDGIVLLQGESGSGKDFLARWIHDHSKRSNGPFFSINCAAVSRELAESELFGHERGAFTGAIGMKKGLLELAEGGTILLNEIGDLALSLQAKLLTFLDTRSFMRVGGQRHIRVNARLIAATHRDLSSEVEEKRFLMPLFYRLSVFPIHVPPLRKRLEDLPVLTEQIMSKLASELQLPAMPVIDADMISVLRQYEWPGNVRELRNVLERSLILWRGEPFLLQMPRPERGGTEWSYLVRYSQDKSLDDVVEEVEISLYGHVLKACKGNKKEAAERLRISRGALYRYLKKWGGKRRD